MKKGKIIVDKGDGWVGYAPQIYEINADIGKFEFEVADDFEYRYDTSTIDGPTFDVTVEFSNDSGSRTERFRLVPMKI